MAFRPHAGRDLNFKLYQVVTTILQNFVAKSAAEAPNLPPLTLVWKEINEFNEFVTR